MSWLSDWLNWLSQPRIRHTLCGAIIGISISYTSSSLIHYMNLRKRRRQVEESEARPIELRSDEIVSGVTGLIGNTPLVRINSLSDALGVEILGKAEFLNPGGSVKDRVALQMIEDAEKNGLLRPYTGSRIFEGTVGSTGISIATIARARGYDATIIMPDDVAQEKVRALLVLGAEVESVRPASIVDKKQYVNLARQRACSFTHKPDSSVGSRSHIVHSTPSSVVVTTTRVDLDHNDGSNDENFLARPRGYFADQFENRANFDAHYAGTGPEIWKQTNGRVHAFVSGAGTGGTVAGTGHYLKSVNPGVIVAISDPDGSGLYNKVKYGVMYDKREAEGTRRRHQVDSVVEGIGINRLTNNIELAVAVIDDAFRITDEEAVAMSRYLLKNDGLFLGSSSACNLMACVKLVKKFGWRDGQHVVTLLCDSGTRHFSKFWNDDYLRNASIEIDPSLVERLLESRLGS